MGKRHHKAGPTLESPSPTAASVVVDVLEDYLDELGNKWYLIRWSGADKASWELEDLVRASPAVGEYERRKAGSAQWSLKSSGSSTKIVLKKVAVPVAASPIASPAHILSEEGDSSEDSGPGGGAGFINGNHHITVKPVQQPVAQQAVAHHPVAHHSTAQNSVAHHSVAHHSVAQQSEPPARNSKRRRSSTIGTEVSTAATSSKRKKRGRKRRQTSEEATLNAAAPSNTPAVTATPEEEEYTVEAILDKCLDGTGRILYHIKWLGYDANHNTWEPVANLNCPALLHAFNARVRQPKMTVSKILERRVVGAERRVEYLVKLNGCRKHTWMFETELQCPDLIAQFEEAERRSKSRISLADIADNCSSSEGEREKEPVPVPRRSAGGIKMNRECVTSSDEDEEEETGGKRVVVGRKKVKSVTPVARGKGKVNGGVETKVKVKPPPVSDDSDSSDVDFEDLLRRYNDSIKEDPLKSAPPSPGDLRKSKSPSPDPEISINKGEKEEDNSKQYDAKSTDAKAQSPIRGSSPAAPLAPLSQDLKDPLPPEEYKLAEFSLPTLIIHKDNEDDKPPTPLDTPLGLLPRPPIPSSLSPKLTSDPHDLFPTPTSQNSSSESTPRTQQQKVVSYPGNLTSDKSELSRGSVRNSATVPGEGDLDDEDSLERELERNLEDSNDGCFTGVDLGSLIFGDGPDKSLPDGGLSMSGLLDTIVNQTVGGDELLGSAFLETDHGKGEDDLLAVISEHVNEMDNVDTVLSELFQTANKESEVPSPAPSPPHSPRQAPSVPSTTEEEHAAVEPPFAAFQGLLSTLKSSKANLKTVISLKTFSKKTPTTTTTTTSSLPESSEDIFSDMGRHPSIAKKSASASNHASCPFCSKKFRDQGKLDSHISYKHPQMLEMGCEKCGTFFQSAIEYQCHQLNCTGERAEGSSNG